MGVVADVEIVKFELQVGSQVRGEKLQFAPTGNSKHEKLTDCVVPLNKVAVTLVVILSSRFTIPESGSTDKEKLKQTQVSSIQLLASSDSSI
jgi:hypothetical protein